MGHTVTSSEGRTPVSDADLSEFETAPARLKVDAILDELDVEKAARLRAALAAPKIGNNTIARVVTGWGHPLSENAVCNWRRRNNAR
jgi:hypothetical protein